MGAFGIFVAIVSLVYVVYYVIQISLDLFGGKSKTSKSAEVIKSGGNIGTGSGDVAGQVEEDSPVAVEEFDNGDYGIKEPGGEEEIVSSGMGQAEKPTSTSGRLKAAEVASGKAEPVNPSYESQQRSEDFDDELRRLSAIEETFDFGDEEDEH